MGVNSATPKGSAAKVGRGARRKRRGAHAAQSARTALNKLRRINRLRRRHGKAPKTQHIMSNGLVVSYDPNTRRYRV